MTKTNTAEGFLILGCTACGATDCDEMFFQAATAADLATYHPHDFDVHEGVIGMWVDCQGVHI